MSPEFRSTSGFVLSASKAARPRAPAVARLPPKPAKLSVVPLTDWYIGPRPLDTQQPLRVFSALTDPGRTLKADDRVSPVPNPLDYTLENDITAEPEATVDPISSGTVVLSVTPAAPTVHAPPPSSPTPRKKKLDNVDSPVKAKNSKTKRVSEDIPKDRTSFTSVYDAGSIGTPITVDHLESQAACKAR